MAVHVITMPDDERGWEPRDIVWDSDAGTVTGGHSGIPYLRKLIREAVADGGKFQMIHGHFQLSEDPWRSPADFLLLLRFALGEICWDPDGVPDALRGSGEPPFTLYRLPPGALA